MPKYPRTSQTLASAVSAAAEEEGLSVAEQSRLIMLMRSDATVIETYMALKDRNSELRQNVVRSMLEATKVP